MKRIVQILALIAFALIMGYGLTRFLAASELRQVMADAERACEAHGGLQEIEVLDNAPPRTMCADGTVPADP